MSKRRAATRSLRPEEFPEANQWLESIGPAGLGGKFIRGGKNNPRHSAHRARTSSVCLHAKFAKTIMTRRSRWSCAASITLSTVSSAQFTRWRLFARTATAELSATAWKRTEKSSVVFTAHAHQAQHS